MWKLDKQNRVVHFARAISGDISLDERENTLILTLNYIRAEVHDRSDPEDTSKVHSGGSDKATFDLPLDRISGTQGVYIKRKWRMLSQLLAEWRALGCAGPKSKMTAKARALEQICVQSVIQEKAAMAFSVFSFAVLAIPLGIKVSCKETSANLGVALVLALVYYFSRSLLAGLMKNRHSDQIC